MQSGHSTLLLHEDDVRQLISMGTALTVIEEAMKDLANGQAENRVRRRVSPPTGTLNVMAATWPSRGVSGIKTYTVASGEAWFLVAVFGLDGFPVALLEGATLGRVRTGAASGLAARALCEAGRKRVGVIGTGNQARMQVYALQKSVEIEEIRVFSRDATQREQFAAELGVTASTSAEQATYDADIVVTATNSPEPVLRRKWVKPGALVLAIGSNVAEHAELPRDLIEAADIVVVDQLETASQESGDLLRAGYDFDLAVELGDVVSGRREVRAGRKTVIFESHGLALWDLATAVAVIDAAQGAGVGSTIVLRSSQGAGT